MSRLTAEVIRTGGADVGLQIRAPFMATVSSGGGPTTREVAIVGVDPKELRAALQHAIDELDALAKLAPVTTVIEGSALRTVVAEPRPHWNALAIVEGGRRAVSVR